MIQILLTPSEVAGRLKMNLLTIYKYIRSGRLVAVRFNRTYRIREKDLENFINSNEMKNSK